MGSGSVGAAATIRPASLQDAAAIGRLHVRTWQLAYTDIVPAEFLNRLSINHSITRWRSRITRGESHILVAQVGPNVAGFCALGMGRDADISHPISGEIYAFYLHPDYWRRGIGSLMMEQALGRLLADGYSNAYLWVLTDNRRAIAFYQAHGFAPDGAQKFDRDEPDAILAESRFLRALVPDSTSD